jgi:hypothetical protein
VSELAWHRTTPLHRPILVAAFAGWFDIAEVATGALERLAGDDAELVASIDPEGFFDFTRLRPEVTFSEDDERVIRWPATAVRLRPRDGGPHDLLVLAGDEPHVRWQTFAALVVEVARTTGCEMVVTVGAVAEQVPHTRTPVVFGSSTNERLARRLGLSRPQYQGVTGIVGVLQDAFDAAALPAISLRVGVPHYLAGAPHPRAIAGLLQHLEHVLGVPTGHADLAEEIEEWAARHDEAVAADSTAGAYVAHLEREHDRRLEAALPSGDELASELEQFLREQRGDP